MVIIREEQTGDSGAIRSLNDAVFMAVILHPAPMKDVCGVPHHRPEFGLDM